MRPKSMILILIALGCGLIASIGISQVVERGSGEAKKIETSPIYVAMSNINIGEELNAQRVKLEEWPVDRIPPGAVTAAEQIENQAPSQPLFAGEPILMGKLASKESLVTASKRIKRGFRVVSFKVQMETAVSNLIQPGDHVDVLALVHDRSGLPRTELVLSNVEVFGINEEIRRKSEQEGTIQAKTVSAQVLPDQASRLVFYAEQSRLTLVLRSPDEDSGEKTGYKTTPMATQLPRNDHIEELTMTPETSVAAPELPAVDPNAVKMQVLDGAGNTALWIFGEDGELPRQITSNNNDLSGVATTTPLPPFAKEGQEGNGEKVAPPAPGAEGPGSMGQGPQFGTPPGGKVDAQRRFKF